MDKNKILKEIEHVEKTLHKQIDDEVKIDNEIEEVAEYVAQRLENSPMAMMSIDGREFLVVASLYNDNMKNRHIMIVAREKKFIDTPMATVIKADVEMDLNYTKKENLVCAMKAMLGHITGRIKPEEV